MIRAILFDCFGVLIGRGFDETYRSVGGDPDTDRNFISSLLGRTNLGLISQSEFRQEITNQLNISADDWRAAVKRAEQPDTDLLEFIEGLHKKFKIAIVSNANRGVVQGKLGETWLRKCFDTVIVSAEVGIVKPDPEIYEFAAKSLEVLPADCVFIDDLNGYVQAAERVGMHGVLFQNLSQIKADLKILTG